MEHIFRGECIENSDLNESLKKLENILVEDILLGAPELSMIIYAVDKLINSFDLNEFENELVANGQANWKAKELIERVSLFMTKKALWTKVDRELGKDFDQWNEIEPGIYEKYKPYGVLMHIGAGNQVALSIISVLEGLLAGNINILKLPSYEGGLSIRLLKKLIEIEPKLKPYIYVFDISSNDTNTISLLSKACDAVIVWGSDAAISGIRQIAPPSLPIIEWGHKISFAYFTMGNQLDSEIEGLAEEICLSNQQYCTSPQSVFIETDDLKILEEIAKKILNAIILKSKNYPQNILSDKEQCEITWIKEVVRMEQVIDNQKLLESKSKDASVLIDFNASLKASPQFRNIWVMPVKRDDMLKILWPYRGYLQTVGLECDVNQTDELTNLFYTAGVNRVTTCENMSKSYIGEPHDGKVTLKEYVRRVSKSN